MDQDELELTQEQLTKIAEYATRVIEGRQADPKKLATALLTVAVCMHRLQAGDPPLSGPEVDRWYDKEIGQNMRVAWIKVKPAAETLKGLGILGEEKSEEKMSEDF